MHRIQFSLRTLVLLCLSFLAPILLCLFGAQVAPPSIKEPLSPRTSQELIPAKAVFTEESETEAACIIISKWKGKSFGAVDYYSENLGFGGLADPKWDQDMRVIKTLGSAGVHLLCITLNAQDYRQRINVLNALQSFGPQAVEAMPRLIPMLEEKDPGTLRAVVGCLIRIGAQAQVAVPKLRELLKSLQEKQEPGTSTITIEIVEAAIRLIPISPVVLTPPSSHQQGQVEPEPKAKDDSLVKRTVAVSSPKSGEASQPRSYQGMREWIARSAERVVENGRIMAFGLTVLFGVLSVWSFLSDRRYFRRLLAAKQAASAAAPPPPAPPAGPAPAP